MDTLHAMPVLSAIRRDNASRRAFVSMAVSGRREDAQRFLSVGLEMLGKGSECGADRLYLIDVAKGLHDAVSNLDGQMRRDLDDVGLIHEHRPIDLAELSQSITTLECGR